VRGVRSIDGTPLLERGWKGEGLRWKYEDNRRKEGRKDWEKARYSMTSRKR
jgi:hypothetical protein